MQGAGDKFAVRLSRGAIENNYLTVRGHLDFFPSEVVGGATDSLPAAPLSLEIEGLDEPVETDINGPKQRFRARGIWRRFFDEQGLKQGDVVEIRHLDGNRYRVSVLERGRGLHWASLSSREAVLGALEEFDRLGREKFLNRYGFGRAKHWRLIYEGRTYDPKAIYGVAFGIQYPDVGPLQFDDFSGGERTVGTRLRELGFEVEQESEESVDPDTRVWLIRAGEDGRYESLALERQVTVIGWADLGDVEAASRDELKEWIRQVYAETKQKSLDSQAGQIYRFVHEVEPGHLVVLPRKSPDDRWHVAIGEITGAYEHQTSDDFGPDARHTRPVDWFASRLPYDRFDADLRDAFGQQGTVSEITKPDAARRLLAVVHGSDASAIHLVLKWSPSHNPETIERHREKADELGAVWWGRMTKSPDATGLASEWVERLRDQLKRGSETFVFLYGHSATTWRARLLDVTLDSAEVETELIPDYYEAGSFHSLWVKLTDFEQIDPVELTRDFVLAKTGDPVTAGGLGNQTPLIIRKRTSSAPSRYFILSQKADGSAYDDLEGARYEWTDHSAGAWKQLSNSPAARFVYYRPGTADDGTSKSYFGYGRIIDIDASEDGELKKFVATIDDYRPFTNPVPFAEGPSRSAQTSIQPITRAEYEKLIANGFPDEVEGGDDFGFDAIREAALGRGLQLSDSVYRQAAAALTSGKHIILTGPPGTAKTTLGQAVADAARDSGLCKGYLLTTATADWTTFETIGGLKPTPDSTLVFEEGLFLQAIRSEDWLVIDELNRSNFDRAFGQLFTVLSGQPVVLPYTRSEAGVPMSGPLTLVPEGAVSPIDGADVLPIARTWRIIATMNVFDKTLLFEMSFALMRRFAFIEVAAPSDDVFAALIEQEASGDPAAADLAKQLLALRSVKDLGPAIYMDIARYLAERRLDGDDPPGDLLFEAFYSYLLPQFEGIDAREGDALFKRLSELVGSGLRDRLRRTLNVVLGLDLQADEPSEEEGDEPLEAETT